MVLNVTSEELVYGAKYLLLGPAVCAGYGDVGWDLDRDEDLPNSSQSFERHSAGFSVEQERPPTGAL